VIKGGIVEDMRPSSWLILVISIGAVSELLVPNHSAAEWYVAGQVGPTFGDRFDNIGATHPDVVPTAPSWDLRNSIAYGAKLGYFPGHGWMGIEGEIFHTTPHLRRPEPDPGLHLRVTTLAINFIARYPGTTFQPYAGIGMGILFSHLGGTPGTPGIQSDSDTSTGLNLLAGLRFFVTPYVSMFTEYKFVQSSLLFSDALGAAGGFVGDYRAQHLMLGVAYHF
jgi:opacity protein-like surface antigen